MSEKGPCVICGATNYELSMGGPTICPVCDCGLIRCPECGKVIDPYKRFIPKQMAKKETR